MHDENCYIIVKKQIKSICYWLITTNLHEKFVDCEFLDE